MQVYSKRSLIIVLTATVFGLVGLLGVRMVMDQTKAKTPLGVSSGQLQPCPESPNCVSTTADREAQRMPAIEFEGSLAEAMQQLERTVQSFSRTRIVEKSERYLHAEFRTLFFRFVDDVEIYIPENQTPGAPLRIEFRSASRVGYSDLGVNRKRMTEFAKRFTASSSNTNL